MTLSELLRAPTPLTWTLLAVLAMALLLGLAWCAGRAEGEAVNRAEAEAARVRVIEAARRADATAAEARARDTALITERQQERADATAHIPDTPPSDLRRARACSQLRQQGDHAAADAAGC